MKTNHLFWILFLGVRLSAQTITTQPTNQIATVGGNVTLGVAVSETGPCTYQWQFNGINLPSGIITTVVTGLSGPESVVVDTEGNLFIADSGNNRIRKMSTNGIITTIAGNGANSFSGDGGTAINAGLSFPSGVAIDAVGNLFISDNGNSRIRSVTTNGIIMTVAGNGTSYSFSGDGGVATNAALSSPTAVAVDAGGNFFFSDNGNNRIRKVGTNGVITTVVGNGIHSYSGDGGAATNAELSGPSGLKLDSNGNLFIADYYNNRIRKVTTNGSISTVAGNGINSNSGDGGIATNAALYAPTGVAINAEGNLFITDWKFNCVRRVDARGVITRVAGNGVQTPVVGGVLKFSASGDGGAAINASLGFPEEVAVDTVGNLFIADTGNNRIRKVSRPSYLPFLTLNTVSNSDAGNYSVIVTGSSGSVTSSVVTLTVVIPPSINAPTILTNGQFQFSFDTVNSVNYAVQYSTNLTQWLLLATSGGTGEPLTVIDPNTTDGQQRFYRISLSPQ